VVLSLQSVYHILFRFVTFAFYVEAVLVPYHLLGILE